MENVKVVGDEHMRNIVISAAFKTHAFSDPYGISVFDCRHVELLNFCFPCGFCEDGFATAVL
jgi:hypothetical protein